MSISDAAPEVLSGAAASSSLISLRREIDAIDDRLHDLLMERAALIERVKTEGGKTGTLIRPGREAMILRRLLSRHQGALPAHTILRIWRELFCAALMIEGRLRIAVAEGAHLDMPAVAREHFGPLTPLRRHASAAQALADVAEGAAEVAVLPLPVPADDTASAWWTTLMQDGLMQDGLKTSAPSLRIIARLPFWGRRLEGTPQVEAYAVAAIEPDASGADRSLIGFEVDPDFSAARLSDALKDAGFSIRSLLQRRPPRHETAYALAEVEGMVAANDPRLAAVLAAGAGLAAPPQLLGAYAIPIGGDDAA